MIKKVLGKTIASAATAGVLIAPMALASSPALMNVACADNPNETTVSVRLEHDAAAYGTKNVATATLSAIPAGVREDVKIEVVAQNGDTGNVIQGVRVNRNGVARKLLPRGLQADDTYSIRAQYHSCAWSPAVTYSVSKAQSDPQPVVRNARKAKFRTTVLGSGDLDAKVGPVSFVVKKRGAGLVADRDTRLIDGVARVNMTDLKPGRYVLKVRYKGNVNFEAGVSKRRFRV